MTSAYCLPGYWLIMEGSPTSAGNLEWFVAELMQAERARPRPTGRLGLRAVQRAGRAASPRPTSEVVFLPFLYGSQRRPECLAPASSACTPATRRRTMLRAVYEGVAFSHKTHIERLLGHRRGPRRSGSRAGRPSPAVWVQMFADVLQLPIEVTGCEELGTMGPRSAPESAPGCSAPSRTPSSAW